MANSYVEIPISGASTYTFPFPYITEADVKVYVGGVLQTISTHYTFTSSNIIEFTTGNVPADTSQVVRIQRETESENKLVTYSNTGLDADDLNLGSDQNFYLAQEATDKAEEAVSVGSNGLLDVSGRLVNLDEPVNNSDAATKGYVATQIAGGNGSGSVTSSSTAPIGASQGDLWIDTDNNIMYVWTGSEWVNGGVQDVERHDIAGSSVINLNGNGVIPQSEHNSSLGSITSLFLNGVLLKPTTSINDFTTGDYDLLDTQWVTLSSVPAADDEITIIKSAAMSASLIADIDTVKASIPALSSIQSDVTTLQSELDTVEADVTTLQSLVSTPQDFGAVGDGSTDDTSALKSWLESGGDLYAPEGTYLVDADGADSGGVEAIISSSTKVTCSSKAIFKAGTNLDNDIIRVTPTSTGFSGTATIDFSWKGGMFDQQAQRNSTSMPYTSQYPASNVGSSSTCDALSVRGDISYNGGRACAFNNVKITQVTCDASSTKHWESAGGDSAIYTDGIRTLRIKECTFTGARDAAIYASGLSSGSDNEISAQILNNKFYGCIQGAYVKRSFRSAVISNNVGYNTAVVVGSDPVTTSSSGCIISNNIGYNAWEVVRVSGVEAFNIHDNISYNHGHLLEDGSAPSSIFNAHNCCVFLLGAEHCTVHSNKIHDKESAVSVSLEVVKFDDYDSTGAISQKNHAYNNSGHNVTRIIGEVSGKADYNIFWNNYGTGVGSAAVQVNGSNSVDKD